MACDSASTVTSIIFNHHIYLNTCNSAALVLPLSFLSPLSLLQQRQQHQRIRVSVGMASMDCLLQQDGSPSSVKDVPGHQDLQSLISNSTSSGKDNHKEGRQRPPRKRSRASKKTPTTVLNTDPTNFRAMVQRFTGLPLFPGSSAYTAAVASSHSHSSALARPLPRRAIDHHHPQSSNLQFLDFASAGGALNSQSQPSPHYYNPGSNTSEQLFYGNNNPLLFTHQKQRLGFSSNDWDEAATMATSHMSVPNSSADAF